MTDETSQSPEQPRDMTEPGGEKPADLYARLQNEALTQPSDAQPQPATTSVDNLDEERQERADNARKRLSLFGRRKGADVVDYPDAPVGIDFEPSMLDQDVPEARTPEQEKNRIDKHYSLDDGKIERVNEAKKLSDDAFNRHLELKIYEERLKIDNQQSFIAEKKREAIEKLGPTPGDLLKPVVVKYDKQISELQKTYEAIPEKLKEQLTKERQKLQNQKAEHVIGIQDFMYSGEKQHIYEPKANDDPDQVVIMAGATSQLLGKEDAPHQVDEYVVQKNDGELVLMQRLVFNTESGAVVVEDWDKNTGTLKRQALIRDGFNESGRLSPLIRPELGKVEKLFTSKQNKEKLVFNEAVYKQLGLIAGTREVPKKEKGTERVGGGGYRGRLVQSGMSSSEAERLNNFEFKAKKNKGFIEMLQESITKKSKKK